MRDDLEFWARRLERGIVTFWIAARDRRTPLAVKLVVGVVAVYSLCPIDLIPDFIPVLGYVDDIIFVVSALALAARMIPTPLLDEYRNTAAAIARPKSVMAACGFGAVWLVILFVALKLAL